MSKRAAGILGVLWIAACGDTTATSATGAGSTGAASSTGDTTGAPTTGGTSSGASTDGGTDSASATGEPTTGSTGAVTSGSTGTTGELTASSSGGDTTGFDTTTGDSSGGDSSSTGEPPPVLGPFDVDDLEAGQGHVCAVLHSGKVKCWGGYNDSGDLGLGNTNPYGTTPNTMGNDLPFVDLGAGLLATSVTSYYHGCAVVTGGKLKCWGQGTFGALGSGASDDLGNDPGEMGDKLPFVDLGAGRTVKQVINAVWTSCAVLDNDTAKCWGWNGNGWLGVGDKNDRGDQPNEMGDKLPAIDFGAGRTVQQIGIDNSHACALLDDATIKCWGQQTEGNLGNGKPGFDAIGDQPGEMGDKLPIVDLGVGRTAKQVSLGARHACALLDNDKVKCWGSNQNGQLGLGDTNNRGDGPGEMGDALPYVDLGKGRTAVQVVASYFHSCAILDDASLKCWGANSFGALGLGDTNDRGDQPGEMGDALKPIDLGTMRTATKVVPGANYGCALLDDHKVKCWGVGGSQGALGYEDMEHRGDQPGEMGDALPYVDLGS
jgi:alpha-tubulin suppressor-like RCC1 family protein